MEIFGGILAYILLVLCAIVCTAEGNDIPQDYEVVIPRVFHYGYPDEIPSSQIPHVIRQRRSASTPSSSSSEPSSSSSEPLSTSSSSSSESTKSSESASTEEPFIYVNISSMQETFHIKLSPNKKLLAPGFRVYHRHSEYGSNVSESTEDNETDDLSDCFFHGNVTSHNDTPAAFSLCRGVTGVLMFPEEDYVIEPMTVQARSEQQQQNHHQRHQKHHKNHHQDYQPHPEEEAHVLYKRSAIRGPVDKYHAKEDFNRYAKLTQNFHRARRKRSYRRSAEYILETLVVVDQEMYRKHGRENITTYVLSLFNIVSQLFKDPSLGYTVNVILVGLVFLDGNEPGLYITHHADKTLNSFCQWQAGIHNGRGKIHDHAVLLTGKDICSYKNAPCDTLGFAPIEGMCTELRSCIVNEDTGLSTAFTIAHELGHNLGMLHDGEGNACKHSTDNIMSATLSAQSGIFRWSECSRQHMRKFLRNKQSECLKTHSGSRAELKFPDRQPGEIFDADTQCRWQFGSHSKQCTLYFGRDPCSKLWCHKQAGMCETKFYPAAEGTSCGNGRWCQQGKCVSYGKTGPSPVHGWWTDWSGWSPCSRTCGGGVKTRTRECNNPRPQYGGDGCKGDDVMHKMCHLTECEDSEREFRQRQCEEHNRQNFRGWRYKWKIYREQQYSDVDDQCKLYCKPDGYNFYYAMSMEVTDGTRCNDYSTDVCVRGKCRHVGCDLIVGSSAKKDNCGVCRGDNSTCKVVENVFSKQPRKNTYFAVVHMPRGSSTISIQEVELSPSNYLVLRSADGAYYLNGDWKLNKEGIYRIAGTKFIYRRPYNRPESLTADGPILEDLVVEILVQGSNPGIRYSFTVPKLDNHLPEIPQHNYTWSVILTDCSEPCAGGSQVVTAHCQRDQEGEVDPAYCDIHSKPGTGTFTCNTDPCRSRWVAGPWNVCSKTCGGGKQKRNLYCMQKLTASKDRKLARKFCERKNKPERKRECNTHECPPVWYKGPWSKCSATCDKGVKVRSVVCRSKTSTGQVVLPDTMCTRKPKPNISKGCREKKCHDKSTQWIITAWTKCTGSCGEGIREREVKCTRKNKSGKVVIIKDKHCKHLQKRRTRLKEPCKLAPCPQTAEKPQWYASPWSKCSVSCGAGNQTRLVHCIHQKYKKLARACDESNKPVAIQPCAEKSCPVQDPRCQDHFSWCQLVPKHNICNHTFYGTKCCRSCHNR